MDTNEFIEKLNRSDNSFFEAMADDVGLLSRIPHNKSGLERFLENYISEVVFKDSKGVTKTVIACSDNRLIKMFALKRNSAYEKNISDIIAMNVTGIHSKSPFHVLSWNLLKNDYCKIPLKAWRIGRWIRISKDNIAIINEAVRDILKKDNGEI